MQKFGISVKNLIMTAANSPCILLEIGGRGGGDINLAGETGERRNTATACEDDRTRKEHLEQYREFENITNFDGAGSHR